MVSGTPTPLFSPPDFGGLGRKVYDTFTNAIGSALETVLGLGGALLRGGVESFFNALAAAMVNSSRAQLQDMAGNQGLPSTVRAKAASALANPNWGSLLEIAILSMTEVVGVVVGIMGPISRRGGATHASRPARAIRCSTQPRQNPAGGFGPPHHPESAGVARARCPVATRPATAQTVL